MEQESNHRRRRAEKELETERNNVISFVQSFSLLAHNSPNICGKPKNTKRKVLERKKKPRAHLMNIYRNISVVYFFSKAFMKNNKMHCIFKWQKYSLRKLFLMCAPFVVVFFHSQYTVITLCEILFHSVSLCRSQHSTRW